MHEPEERTLHDRVAALEALVSDLQRQVARLQPEEHAPASPGRTPGQEEAPPRQPPPGVRPAVRAAGRSRQDAQQDAAGRLSAALKSEDWLNKIGIALLLFGLAFLFKYSIDQGWLGPSVRVAFGAVLGVCLLGLGLRLWPQRKRLGQVLLGGSMATFYVTLFAAYQLYGLVPYAVAFAGMTVVTLLAFVLAVRQDEAVLAVVATLGGLGTPFLLYTGTGNLAGLVAFTCGVLASACGIWFYRGWRSLLLSFVVGGWLVFLIAWARLTFSGPGTFTDRTAFLAGTGFCWLAFGVVPVLRAALHRRDPDRWKVPELRFFKGFAPAERPALGLSFVAPLVTLALTYELWSASDFVHGLVIAGVAVLYAAVYLHLHRRDLRDLAASHGAAAAVLLAVSLFELSDSVSVQLTAFAAEAALLHAMARRYADRVLRLTGHAFFGIVALWMARRLLQQGGNAPALLNEQALVDLVVLALGFGALWTMRAKRIRAVYGLAAYAGLLAWFWRDLAALPNGQAYVSVAWGLCAVGLLALGWRRDTDLVRNAGLGTLLLVVGKLFVVDLSELEAVWRILLFLGFGGLLLLLSYFFPSLWRPRTDAVAEDPVDRESPL